MLIVNMKKTNPFLEKNYSTLKKDCENCCGLCCVALYFSKVDGFPKDKVAGQPCLYLNLDNHCTIYNNLHYQGLKGCKGYDCFGAGPKVTQDFYNGNDWRNNMVESNEMFRIFLVIMELHEFLWYFVETCHYDYDMNLKKRMNKILKNTYSLTNQPIDTLLNTDLLKLRNQVSFLLKKISQSIRLSFNNYEEKFRLENPLEYLGKDMRNEELKGQSLRGACLIQSNLEACNLSYVDVLGVDFRDANIKNANLKQALFLNQRQVNVAIGNKDTILPKNLEIPDFWK